MDRIKTILEENKDLVLPTLLSMYRYADQTTKREIALIMLEEEFMLEYAEYLSSIGTENVFTLSFIYSRKNILSMYESLELDDRIKFFNAFRRNKHMMDIFIGCYADVKLRLSGLSIKSLDSLYKIDQYFPFAFKKMKMDSCYIHSRRDSLKFSVKKKLEYSRVSYITIYNMLNYNSKNINNFNAIKEAIIEAGYEKLLKRAMMEISI